MKAISKVFVLVMLLLCVGTTWGQGAYKYKNLTLTAQSIYGKMDVSLLDNDTFVFSDSLVRISVNLEGRNIQRLTIYNQTDNPIIVRYKEIATFGKYLVKGGFAKSKYLDQILHIDDKFSDITDPSKGEETIYPDGNRIFSFPTPKMIFGKIYYFNKAPENISVDMSIPLVVNGREKTYGLRFTGLND